MDSHEIDAVKESLHKHQNPVKVSRVPGATSGTKLQTETRARPVKIVVLFTTHLFLPHSIPLFPPNLPHNMLRFDY